MFFKKNHHESATDSEFCQTEQLVMRQVPEKPLFIVSACLVGLCTRYDGTVKPNPSCLKFLQGATWIPVCPEQLGGLPTPRPAADILSGDGYDVLKQTATVATSAGADLSTPFIKGAKQVLQIARNQNVTGACLKARSPSCAVSGTIGVTAALLREEGLTLHEF